MKKFFTHLIKSNKLTPPDPIIKEFIKNFKNAINIEWLKKGNVFEATFYKNKIEYIAVFDISGKLKDYKMHLPESFLPDSIKSLFKKKGEIMNAVLINSGNGIAYEIIYRDIKLNRFLMLVNEFGKSLKEREL